MNHAIDTLEEAIQDMASAKAGNQSALDQHLRRANDHMIARDSNERKLTDLKQALMTLREAQPKEAMGLVSDSMRNFNQQQSMNQCETGKAPRV